MFTNFITKEEVISLRLTHPVMKGPKEQLNNL